MGTFRGSPDVGVDSLASAVNDATAQASAASASASAASSSASAASTSETNADTDATATAADLVLTNADVVLTNADVVSTNADVVTTTQDAIDTAADVVITTQDAIDTAADAVSTAADVVTTANKLPLAGGAMTGTITGFKSTGIDDNATTTAITIDASENVGIGVTPAYKLDVVEGSANTTRSAGSTMEIIGADVGITSRSGTLMLSSNSDQAIDRGGSLVFGGRWQVSNTAQYGFAAIKGAKENSTTALAGGYLALAVSNTSGSITEALRLDSSQNATFSGNVIIANGKGITFTTTSTTTGTEGSRILDDYEEGTWVPTYVGAVTNPTVGYTTQNGTYTKIGRVVTISCNINTSSVSGGGTASDDRLRIAGLPFTATTKGGCKVANITNWGASVSGVIGVYATGTVLIFSDGTSVGTDMHTADLRTSADSNQIFFSLSYFT